MDLYQLAKQKQFIIDCQEANLLSKQVAERKLEQIKLLEETLIRQIMELQNKNENNTNINSNTNDNNTNVLEDNNESDNLVSSVIDN